MYKKYLIKMLVLMVIVSFVFYLYKIYDNIEIKNLSDTNTTKIERTSQNVENIKNENKNIADVIERASKNVVGISKLKDNGNSIFLQEGIQQLGLGTGVVVSENGYILTNEHVSGTKYSNCYITLDTGKEYTGNVVWSNSDIDLSIVKINAKGLKYAELGNSDEIRIGETVYAIGNPIGFEFQRTVTSGIISALDRTIKLDEKGTSTYMEDLIQTDATINPGNSGGPLITPEGKIIGINSVKITSAEGIGFAIPINVIKPVIKKFIQIGNFEEAYMGIFSYDKKVIPYLSDGTNFENGIYVAQVSNNGPAYNAGVKVGDIITRIDNQVVDKMIDFREYVYSKNPNDEVTLNIIRNNKNIDLKVKLGKKN